MPDKMLKHVKSEKADSGLLTMQHSINALNCWVDYRVENG